MGMFDSLRCLYPLPVAGANTRDYQTKDTPCQSLNKYEITANGVLRHKEIDYEDNSESGDWVGHPDLTGEICFYDLDDGGGWIEFSSYFVNGVLSQVHLIRDTTKEPM